MPVERARGKCVDRAACRLDGTTCFTTRATEDFAMSGRASGIARRTGCYGFTVTSADFDGDGYPDLYVACDSTPSLLSNT